MTLHLRMGVPFVLWCACLAYVMMRTSRYDSPHRASTVGARRGSPRWPRSKQAVLPARSRKLPSAIYFESDVLARAVVRQCARIQHSSFESLEPGRLGGENVFILADAQLFAEHLKKLRAPNVRVIALSDERFRDARLDGTVYAYLPRNTPAALLERMFDNAIDHMHLVQTRREANDKLALANSEIYELNHIGAALSAEHDTRELMELILTKCREITRADAGSIYLVEEEEPERSGVWSATIASRRNFCASRWRRTIPSRFRSARWCCRSANPPLPATWRSTEPW